MQHLVILEREGVSELMNHLGRGALHTFHAVKRITEKTNPSKREKCLASMQSTI